VARLARRHPPRSPTTLPPPHISVSLSQADTRRGPPPPCPHGAPQCIKSPIAWPPPISLRVCTIAWSPHASHVYQCVTNMVSVDASHVYQCITSITNMVSVDASHVYQQPQYINMRRPPAHPHAAALPSQLGAASPASPAYMVARVYRAPVHTMLSLYMHARPSTRPSTPLTTRVHRSLLV
jgi:hypothetical protein